MTDAHDPRLEAEREAVRNAAARIVAGEDDFMGTEWGTALDALIDAAMALGAEPLVEALKGLLDSQDDSPEYWAAADAARAALAATDKEVTE